MDDLEALLDAARDIADAVVRKATDQLLVGVDITRIHEDFLVAAIDILEEVEQRAVLAATGDPGALAQVSKSVDDLRDLYAKLEEEQAG